MKDFNGKEEKREIKHEWPSEMFGLFGDSWHTLHINKKAICNLYLYLNFTDNLSVSGQGKQQNEKKGERETKGYKHVYDGEFPKYNDSRFKLNWGEMILHNNVMGL